MPSHNLAVGNYFDRLAYLRAVSRKAETLRARNLKLQVRFMKARRKVGIWHNTVYPDCFHDLWLLLHDEWSTRVMLQEDPQGFYQEYFRLQAECNVEIRKLKGGA